MSTTRWPVPSHTRTFPEASQLIGGLTPTSGPAAYSLDCQPGTFTVTGVLAAVVRDIAIDAQDAAFTVTGTDATLAAGFAFDAQDAAYAVTGADATFQRTFSLDCQPGSYTLTGTAATLAADRLFSADPGEYTVDGVDVTFVRSFDLDAQPGSYTVTGVAATLDYVPAPAAPPNTAIRAIKAHQPKLPELTSQVFGALEPAAAYELNAEPGTITVTGIDATFTHNVPDVWDRIVSPTYAISTLQIEYGSRIFGGVEVVAGDAYELDCQPGSFNVTGTAATLAAARLFDAQPGSFTVTGANATLARGLFVNAEPGSYAVTGSSATLTHFTSILFSSTASVTTTITLSGGTQIATRIFAAAVWLLRKRKKRKRTHV